MSSPSNLVNKRVLFMHGLETGSRGGYKVQILKRHFQHVMCPAMNTKIAIQVTKVMCVFSLLSIFVLVGGAMVKAQVPFFVVLASWPVSFVGAFVFWKKVALPFVLSMMVMHSINVQRKAMEEFDPDIVVASSWGGCIAVECLTRGIWTGPTLLLAPASGLVGRKRRLTSQPSLPEGVFVDIVQGLKDATVPMRDSVDLSQTGTTDMVRLHERNDIHTLRYTTQQELKEFVCDLLERAKSFKVDDKGG
eukprot:TRINITY_DN17373_c0_g1_i2.p1 TRINITY_DN17373_c0_g1~~TRINITY_DN17373_c0_g1_i2.p1  ORF type:complete len:248 (-),score=50.03 TRINITY_DN17373_c0_g1_i2:151-894(-)